LQVPKSLAGIILAVAVGAAALAAAQAPAPTPAQDAGANAANPQAVPSAPGGAAAPAGRGGRAGRGAPAYPVRPPADPAVVARGKQIFSVNCSFCHGSDARGGEGGPNLIRSELVMNDKNGEIIATVVQNGRPDKGMPKFDLTLENISDIAAFIHSFPVGGRAAILNTVDPLVGDAKAGEAYFNGPGKCSTCHSVTGDLAGIGAKYTDVRALQGSILMGEGGRGRGAAAAAAPPPGAPDPLAKTVTVTLPTGETVEGKLDRIDDFVVSLTETDGTHRSLRRDGDVPKVVVKNPLQPHLDMLRTFNDTDMHNLTAYLVTLK
jgi:cytochrome c oxidase cbb3-type subunit 3